jgi:hypothetical protein
VEDPSKPIFLCGLCVKDPIRVYTAMGELDRAMDWLEKAYDQRILFLCNLGRDRAAGFDIRPNARSSAI